MYKPSNTIELSTEEEAAEVSNYQDSIRYIFPPSESLNKCLGGFASPGVRRISKSLMALPDLVNKFAEGSRVGGDAER